MKNLYFSALFICISLIANAQDHSHAAAQPIKFPNITGYITLKTDFHQHTVFSDGNVWPTIRVQEALRENLDAISLTEHLEYQPHKTDIPHPDRNRSFDIALKEAKGHDLLVISGAEITRSAPIGHSNAIFISDANKLKVKDAQKAFEAAKKQNAFVFWNHPYWHAQNSDGNPILSDFQKERIKNGELHGIEVINTYDYSEESLALALEHNLAIMGTSDIHGLIDWDYTEKGNHRPITLVFAKKKTKESIKEALFAGRTAAVFNSLLVGKEEFLKPLIKESIKIKSAKYIGNTSVLEIELENVSSSDLLFENASDYGRYNGASIFEVKGGKTNILHLKTLTRLKEIELKLTALKAFVAPKKNPIISWKVKITQ